MAYATFHWPYKLEAVRHQNDPIRLLGRCQSPAIPVDGLHYSNPSTAARFASTPTPAYLSVISNYPPIDTKPCGFVDSAMMTDS